MFPNIFLPDLKTNRDKNRKNVATNFCHFSENNFSDRNLSKTGNTRDEKFFNYENEEKLMPVFEKAKWILSKNLIETMELHLENLRIKDLVSFYGMKNMTGYNQHWVLKESYSQEIKDKIQ